MRATVISEKEVAVLEKHEGMKEVIAQGHGIDPILGPKFIAYYVVRVNGRLLYREDAVKSGDNLQALVDLIGLDHGFRVKGPITNPFEFESVEQVADTLARVGVPKFTVSSYIIWNQVHTTFDI